MQFLTSLAFEWPEESRCVASELKEECDAVVVLESAGGHHWHTMVNMVLLGPCYYYSSQRYRFVVVAYVLLDTVKELSGNDFIL